MPDLILASASPRRQELLRRLGLPFSTDAPDVDESTPLRAREAVQELARRKALTCVRHHPGCVILAADTLVTLDGSPLGKPADEADAFRMLRALSGKTHQVFTGVCCVAADGSLHRGLDTSHVSFCGITDAEIRAYIATGEPMDKAGAYAIQGGAMAWIRELRGSPSGVIGLPLTLTRDLLRACGLIF